jgi:hypothetical protein
MRYLDNLEEVCNFVKIAKDFGVTAKMKSNEKGKEIFSVDNQDRLSKVWDDILKKIDTKKYKVSWDQDNEGDVIVKESAKVKESVLKDVASLSSGTLASLSGFKDYKTLEKLQNDLVDFVLEVGEQNFDNWMDVWESFNLQKRESTVITIEKEIRIKQENNILILEKGDRIEIMN